MTGCTSDPTSPITVESKPVVNVTGPTVICEGDVTTLSPTSGGTWITSNQNVATVSDAGVVTASNS